LDRPVSLSRLAIIVNLPPWVLHAIIKSLIDHPCGFKVSDNFAPVRKRRNGMLRHVNDIVVVMNRGGSVNLEMELDEYALTCVPGAKVMHGMCFGAAASTA
jgi:hypothetical protein